MIDPLLVAQWRRSIDRLFSEATTLREKFALGEMFASACRMFPACALAFEQIRAEEEERARLHAITGCADPIEARRMLAAASTTPPVSGVALVRFVYQVEAARHPHAPRRIRKRLQIKAGGGRPSQFREVVDRRRHEEWERYKRTAIILKGRSDDSRTTRPSALLH